MQAEKQELAQRVADFENIVVDLRSTKDEKINDLERQLATIETRYNKNLTKIKSRKEEVQHQLSVEVKESEMIGLKLD